MNKMIIKKAANIKLFITDVDGVLTDGSLIYGNDGEEFKSFNSQDGLGFKLLQDNNIITAIITGRRSQIVSNRADELDIDEVFQGIDDKIEIYEKLLNKYSLTDKSVSYIGDDLNDLPILKRTGLSFSVENGVKTVKKKVDYVSEKRGGNGAVREVIDLILQAKSEYLDGGSFD